jgi:hypothetical protein
VGQIVIAAGKQRRYSAVMNETGLIGRPRRALSADTSPETERLLIGLLRQAPPARKFAMIVSANLAGRALAMAGLRARHPEASPAQLRRRLAEVWLGPELAAKAYGPVPAHA